MKALALLCVLAALGAGLVVTVGGTAALEPCQPGDVLVEISGFAYAPPSPTVAPGTTVCWTNKDPVSHTVTSGSFDSGVIGPNQSFRHTFSAEGTYFYGCDVPGHVMSGQIVVSGGAPPPPPPPPGPPPPPPPPPPPSPQVQPLAVSGVRISVVRRGGKRMLLARARVTRAATAKLSLVRGRRTQASARKRWVAGANTIQAALPASLPRGRSTAVLQVGSRRFSRSVRIG
jgi:plastocyanin